MSDIDPVTLAKAMLWEEAKGKMRAMVAADGCRTTGGVHRQEPFRYQVVSAKIEAFIADFEADELQT